MAMKHGMDINDQILGTRDDSVREPETFDQFLRRARALGFSDGELARLQALYKNGLIGEQGEYRGRRQGD